MTTLSARELEHMLSIFNPEERAVRTPNSVPVTVATLFEHILRELLCVESVDNRV